MITYKFRGVRSGGGAEPPGPAWRGSFNITYACISLPQAIYILHCIALHSPKLKIKKRNKIYSDSQQYPSRLCLIK